MVEILVRKKIDSEETLGTFISKDYYDRILETDCDLYAESLDGSCTEDNIIFKYRKNVFTKEEQDAAYAGLREAAVESQNRGMAAGPRGDMLGAQGRGGRDWVTSEELELLEFLSRPDNTDNFEDRTIESIRKRHKGGIAKDETRDRKSTRLNSSHVSESRMPSSA